MSHEPYLSANITEYDEVKPGAVPLYLGFYRTAEEITSKSSATRPCDEGCATSRHFRWGPLPSNKIARIANYVKERKKERKN